MSLLLPMVILAGCTEHELHRNTYEDVFAQELAQAVDVLFVVDNSVSMKQEQELVAEGFFRFVEQIDNEDLSVQLGVVTTDMDRLNPEAGLLIGDPPILTPDHPDYVPAFMERVQVGTEGSNKEQGLEAALVALEHPENEGFVRDGAALAIVFVSDENDCSNYDMLEDDADGALCYEYDKALAPVTDFVRGYQGMKGKDSRVVVSGITGPEVSEGCEDSWPGHRYQTVIDTLDGVNGNICRTNYEDLMDDMGARIAGPIRVFQLTYAAIEESIEVSVDNEVIAPDPDVGWTYDEEFWMVRFDGDYYPPPASQITINYVIAGS